MDKIEIFDKDYKIFNIIFRLLKDYNIFKADDIKNIKERCYQSRQIHQGENYLTNVCYWLNDSNIVSYTRSTTNKKIINFLYIIRLINLFDTYERSPCVAKINEYIDYFIKRGIFFDRIYNYHENK